MIMSQWNARATTLRSTTSTSPIRNHLNTATVHTSGRGWRKIPACARITGMKSSMATEQGVHSARRHTASERKRTQNSNLWPSKRLSPHGSAVMKRSKWMKDSMDHRTLAITGATSGIGKATAEALAADFDESILLARNVVKAQLLKKELRSGKPGLKVSV